MPKAHRALKISEMTATLTISAMTFSDVTKQNGRASVGTLYREVLGEIVFPYDSIYNSKKCEGEAFSI